MTSILIERGLPKLYNLLQNRDFDVAYLMSHIQRGRQTLFAEMERLHLNWDPSSMTMLHPSSDIEVQAVVLCIPSYDFPDEIEAKAQAHWFSHFYDDHVDRLLLDPDPDTNKVLVEELKAKRQDIVAIIDMLGDIGELCKLVARSSKEPQAVLQAVHRLTYSGLVQRADSSAFQRTCLEEHMELALRRLTDRLARDIRERVSAKAMYTTSKTIQELLHAFEGKVDFNLSEAENLLCGPALFLNDIAREKQVEGTVFHGELEPSVEDMKRMIAVFGEWIGQLLDERKLARLGQAQFFFHTFAKALPRELHAAYRDALTAYERVARKPATRQ